jgi:hypothetical protein
MRRIRLGALALLLFLALAVAAVAQQSSSASAPSASGSAQSVPRNEAPEKALPNAPSQSQSSVAPINEGHERVLGVVPAFSVTNRQDAPALTKKEKFVLFARQAYDPFEFVAVGLEAGISQWQGEFPEYGQGAAGYGKRYGAALLDGTDSNFFSNFAYPVLFKQDPRYFRLGQGSIKRRILYCFEQEFVTRSDAPDRHRTFNLSNVMGAFTTGAISNAYYPQSDRGLELTLSRSAISLLYGAAGGLSSEFWPDINRRFFQREHKVTVNDASSEPQPQASHP